METIAAYFTLERVLTLLGVFLAVLIFNRLDRRGAWGKPVEDADEWRALAVKPTQWFMLGLTLILLPLLIAGIVAVSADSAREFAPWQKVWIAFLTLLCAGYLVQTVTAIRCIRKWQVRFSNGAISYLSHLSNEREVRPLGAIRSVEERVFRPSRIHFADETVSVSSDAAGYDALWMQVTQEMARRA